MLIFTEESKNSGASLLVFIENPKNESMFEEKILKMKVF